MVQHALDAVCDTIEGCQLVAFADLSTQMVLLTNSNASQTRDALNVLCQQAASALNGSTEAMMGTALEFTLFLRAKAEPNDVLCCVCSLSTDIAALLAAMHACLDEISDGDAS